MKDLQWGKTRFARSNVHFIKVTLAKTVEKEHPAVRLKQGNPAGTPRRG